jgi:hypothetical protein
MLGTNLSLIVAAVACILLLTLTYNFNGQSYSCSVLFLILCGPLDHCWNAIPSAQLTTYQ